ncbi:MAG: DUF5320 domain-containing protein [Desulfobacteraceae bacterium]|nr:DUF5320 domain-containing protein [Desulfobacteraceae bacterium]
MPGMDGTGPMGQGPRSGGGFGICGNTTGGGTNRRRGGGRPQAGRPRCRRRRGGGAGAGMRGGTRAGSAGAPARTARPRLEDSASGQ